MADFMLRNFQIHVHVVNNKFGALVVVYSVSKTVATLLLDQPL